MATPNVLAHELTSGLRVALCVYGPIDRASPITYISMRRMLLEPMRAAGMRVTIFTFDLLLRPPAKIDGVPVCENKIFPCDVCTSTDQASLQLAKTPKKFFTRYTSAHWVAKENQLHAAGSSSVVNALRQLYSESRVGGWLRENLGRFDVAIACCPDLFFARHLNLTDVLIAAGRHPDSAAAGGAERLVYTTNLNDEGGITNGFYIGSPSALAPLLSRYHNLSTLDARETYEKLLSDAFRQMRRRRRVTKMVFFKVCAHPYILPRAVCLAARLPLLPSASPPVSLTARSPDCTLPCLHSPLPPCRCAPTAGSSGRASRTGKAAGGTGISTSATPSCH